MAKLIVHDKQGKREYPLKGGEVFLGRVQSNQVVIRDPKASRKHCKIVAREKGFWVVDLGSRNGIYVNGKFVKEALLKHGDVIEIGDTKIQFLEEPSASFALEILSGALKGKRFPLEGNRLLIGRLDQAEICLPDEGVELRHAQILKVEGQYLVVGLGKEAIKHKGKSVAKLALSAGTFFELGPVKCRVVELSSSQTDDWGVEEILLEQEEGEERENPSKALEDALEEEKELTLSSKEAMQQLKQSPWEAFLPVLLPVTFFLTLGLGIHFLLRLFATRDIDPSPSGNLIKNWSFEQEGRWLLRSAKRVEKPFRGYYSVEVLPGEGVIWPKEIFTPEKKALLFRCFLKTLSDAPVILEVTWKTEGKKQEEKSWRVLSSQRSQWREVSRYLKPPAWAQTFQFRIFCLGGKAWLDRVYLAERDLKSLPKEGYEWQRGNLFLRISPQGILDIFHRKSELLSYRKGYIRFSPWAHQQLLLPLREKVLEGKGLWLQGKIYLPKQSQWMIFEEKIEEVNEGIRVSYSWEKEREFYFYILRESSLPFRKAMASQKEVRELILGEGERQIVLYFSTPYAFFEEKPSRRGWVFLKGRGSHFTFLIASASLEEKKKIESLLSSVYEEMEKKRFEKAEKLIQDLSRQFSHRSRLLAKLSPLLQKISKRKNEWKELLRDWQQEREKFAHPFFFEVAKAFKEKLGREFPSLLPLFQKTVKMLQKIHREKMQEQNQRELETHFSRAKAKWERYLTSRSFSHLVDALISLKVFLHRFPQSPHRQRVEKQLQSLGRDLVKSKFWTH